MRCLVVTASARSLPAFTFAIAEGTSTTPSGTCRRARRPIPGRFPCRARLDLHLRHHVQSSPRGAWSSLGRRGHRTDFPTACDQRLSVAATDRHQEEGNHRQHRDRRQVLLRLVGHRRVEVDVGRERARGGEPDGVAVGRRLRHRVDADHAARAGAVLHHHRLAELVAHARRDRAQDEVRAAARREADDEADRLGGVGLRNRAATQKSSSENIAR